MVNHSGLSSQTWTLNNGGKFILTVVLAIVLTLCV